jgi:hypothetical protein
MWLTSFKNDMYSVDEEFHHNFDNWCAMSKKEQEEIISKYPVYIRGGVRTITEKEFSQLEQKNWGGRHENG